MTQSPLPIDAFTVVIAAFDASFHFPAEKKKIYWLLDDKPLGCLLQSNYNKLH